MTTQHAYGWLPYSLFLLVRDQKQHREKRVSINLQLLDHTPSLREVRTETQNQQEPGDRGINAETVEGCLLASPHGLPILLSYTTQAHLPSGSTTHINY